MKFNLYLIMISTFLFLGCSKSEKTEKANVEVNIRGKWIGDRKYINEYFGFEENIDKCKVTVLPKPPSITVDEISYINKWYIFV